MSTCFASDNALIDGLMLEKCGMIFENSKAVDLKVCLQCKSSLMQEKIPSLALANGLFHGTLPDQFSDLTWVEEKICAIYSITAHITRLFQSSDPSQPKVFHGNTCVHDMNIMSTTSVLPWTPADINGFLNSSVLDQYLVDDSLLGLHEQVVEDHELDEQCVFSSETAGFATHPAELLEVSNTPASNVVNDDKTITLLEKMGVSDPECDKVSGRTFMASTI
ncbi:hypothetical protein BDR05DRAFT_945415 [Suillus weaverae]|nr:hypothetical protein BDR05DRAFT_945415 [Suillus weaverae]